MTNILIKIPESLYQKLDNNAFSSHASFNSYINAVLKANVDYVPNLEKAHFIGTVVSRKGILDNHNTVILGGSNYVYAIQGTDNIDDYENYRVIDFAKGAIILKPIRRKD